MRILKRVFFVLVLPILFLVLLANLVLAPPHYFIVNAGNQAKYASFAVGDAYVQPATMFAGFVFARTSVVESSAIIEVTFANGSKRQCRFGYFTSSEVEPHYLSINQCDDRWH